MAEFKKIMQSPFSLIFGFISSLVSTDFIEAASLFIFQYDEFLLIIKQAIIVILCGFWFFYIIYGTVVWLLFTEYNPSATKIPASLEKMIILRFLEFIPFIWLYDIIRIIDIDTVPHPINNPYLFRPLSRLALDIGFILLIWLIWKVLFLIFTNSIPIDKKEIIPTIILLISGLVMGSAYWWLGIFNTYGSLGPIIVLYILTIVYIILDFNIIHKEYYRTINEILEKIFQ